MSVAYLNGSFVSAIDALVRADDAGLQFGRGVYETFRARRGAVFRLSRHVRRLRSGATLLGISVPPVIEDLATVVYALCRRCGLDDARVRLTLTAGPPGDDPTFLMQARPVTDYPPDLYHRGMVATVATVRRNETSPLSGIKSLNCLDSVMSREQAQSAGADTALLLNTRGLVAEASTANVFVARKGSLFTPPLDDGALPGVTRGAIIDLASDAGLTVLEKPLTLEELLLSDEVFLTSAVMGVMPLVRVDGQPIGEGLPGAVTARVRTLYEEAARGGPP